MNVKFSNNESIINNLYKCKIIKKSLNKYILKLDDVEISIDSHKYKNFLLLTLIQFIQTLDLKEKQNDIIPNNFYEVKNEVKHAVNHADMHAVHADKKTLSKSKLLH